MWGYFCNDAGSAGASCTLAKGPTATAPTATWTASTAYTVGQVILDPTGNVQRVTVAGTSGTTAPTFATTPGTTTPDNTVTWTDFGTAAQYQASYSATWAPPVITVPTGQDLTIKLTNNLSFQPPTPAGGTAPPANAVPTSLVIVGQLGGGLGTVGATCATGGGTCTPSPAHAQQGVTWPIANTVGGGNPAFTPPPQGSGVQSFGTEVAAGAPTSLCWGVCGTPGAACQPASQTG